MTEHQSLVPVEPAAPAVHRIPRLVAAWTALSLLVLLAAGMVGYLAWDDARAHADAAQQAGRASDLEQQLGAARAQSSGLSAELTAVRSQNTQLQGQLRSPTLTMWNSCGGPCTVGPGSVRVGSVPDTFQLLIAFKSDVPVRGYVFTFHQWTQFDGCGFDAGCVSGSYQAYPAATSLDTTFSAAEGCSGYVWVLMADTGGTITPNVRVRYQPAAQPTGACVTSP